MRLPKFSIGDPCVTYTALFPEISGKNSCVVCVDFNETLGYRYQIELTGSDIWWLEHLLHKPPKTGEFDFNSLLEELKNVDKIKV